jgi:AcrR family transcriptional regulator
MHGLLIFKSDNTLNTFTEQVHFWSFMVTRQEQKTETRLKLLEIARQLFDENGFEATSMREIAKTSGLAVGSLFVHFENKTDLLAALLSSDLVEVMTEAERLGKKLSSPLSRLFNNSQLLLNFYAQKVELSKVLLREVLLLTKTSRPELTKLTEGYLGLIGQEISLAQQSGEIKHPGNVADLSVMYFSLYLAVLLDMLNSDTVDPDVAGTNLRKLVSSALICS